jgi:hypothetical protein
MRQSGAKRRYRFQQEFRLPLTLNTTRARESQGKKKKQKESGLKTKTVQTAEISGHFLRAHFNIVCLAC